MRTLIGTGAALATWCGFVYVIGRGWAEQRAADQLDARRRHAEAMRALANAVTPSK